MAGDNNRQERREEHREDRQEFREEFREDDVLVFGHDFDDCCDIEDDFELDEEEFFVSDFDHFVPWYFFIEEIDIDCDGVDDRWDGWIHDECEVEVEFFDFD